MSTELDSFESKLLTALRDQVDAGISTNIRTSTPHGPHRARLRKLALVTGVIAAATATVLFMPGIGNDPAYSVQEGNAGKIVVEVNRFEDAEGLEAALAKRGIDSQITYVRDGQQCVPGRFDAIPSDGISLSLGSELFRITLNPGTVRRGEVLVIDASIVQLPDAKDPDTGVKDTNGSRIMVQAGLASAPVPACVPTPAVGS